MLKPNIPEQDLAKVSNIVLGALKKCFTPEDFTFGPIVVEPDYGQDGDEILWIRIIFDGELEKLVPRLTRKISRDIGSEMDAHGITAYPIASYIEKSEWDDLDYWVPDYLKENVEG